MKVQRLTRCSFLCALCVALLYAASVFQTLSLTIAAIAGFMPKFAEYLYGKKYGFMVFSVTSLLAILLVPAQDIAILYATFFGCYPLLKDYFEKPKSKFLSQTIKLVYFNTLLCVLWVLARTLIFGEIHEPKVVVVVLWIGLNVFFRVFDIAMGKAAEYYAYALFRRIGKQR